MALLFRGVYFLRIVLNQQKYVPAEKTPAKLKTVKIYSR